MMQDPDEMTTGIPSAATKAGAPSAPRARPWRIAMATSQYLPDRGGTAIHTHELASRLVRAGLDVTVFTTTFDGGNVGASSEDGIRVERVRAWPRDTDYYFAPHLARLLSADDFDLVHCQGYHTLV